MNLDLGSFLSGARLTAAVVLLQLYIIPKTRIVAFISKLRGNKQPTLRHMVSNATIRWLARSLSIHQFRAATSSDMDVHRLLQNCSELLESGVEHEYIHMPEFRAWHLIRSPNSTHTIMYIHGGGFVSGSPSSVSSYLLQLHLELRARGLHSDVIAVEYDLAPEYPYPHALQQIVSAYEHIQAQCKPIVLVGDSAGGNLCLALLRHLVHPHPQISSPRPSPNSSQGIVALCLASPWVDLRKNSISCHGRSSDCLDRSALDSWRDAYLGGQPVSEYASPLGFPTSTRWKEILPPKVLLMSGELDLFLAQIKSLGEEIKKDGYQGLDITIEPLKGHVWNLVDYGGAIPGVSQGKDVERMEAFRGVCLQADWISEHCNP